MNAIEVSVYQSNRAALRTRHRMTFALSQLISNSHLGHLWPFRIIRPIFRHFPQVQNPACSSFQVTQICFGTGDLTQQRDGSNVKHVWSPSCGRPLPTTDSASRQQRLHPWHLRIDPLKSTHLAQHKKQQKTTKSTDFKGQLDEAGWSMMNRTPNSDFRCFKDSSLLRWFAPRSDHPRLSRCHVFQSLKTSLLRKLGSFGSRKWR